MTPKNFMIKLDKSELDRIIHVFERYFTSQDMIDHCKSKDGVETLLDDFSKELLMFEIMCDHAGKMQIYDSVFFLFEEIFTDEKNVLF